MRPSLADVANSRSRAFSPVMTIALIGAAAVMGWAAASWSRSPPPARVIYGHWNSFPRTAAPTYGGSEGVIVRSSGGKVVAGVFTHSGKYSYTFPFDEFAIVTAGTVRVTVDGQPSFTLSEGHFVYFPKGVTAHFDAGEDYANVAVFVGSEPIKW